MFHGYIALRKECPACGLDYAMFDAGDGPMVFGILIVGAIVCGLALWVEFTWMPPLWVHALLWLPLICLLTAIFLIVCLFRAIAGQFTPTRHFGFEAAAWYWHFVDVVWLFLFACIYVWGEGPLTQG